MDEACARRGFDWKHSITFYTNSNFRFGPIGQRQTGSSRARRGAFFFISAGRFRALPCASRDGATTNNHCASVFLGAAAIVLNARRLIFSTAIVDSILLTAFLHSQTRARARTHTEPWIRAAAMEPEPLHEVVAFVAVSPSAHQ